jgi:hypothetical protein
MAQVCDLAIFALLYNHRKCEAMRTEKEPTLIVLHEETPVFTSHSNWLYPLLELEAYLAALLLDSGGLCSNRVRESERIFQGMEK